jgi:hypothetical protein
MSLKAYIHAYIYTSQMYACSSIQNLNTHTTGIGHNYAGVASPSSRDAAQQTSTINVHADAPPANITPRRFDFTSSLPSGEPPPGSADNKASRPRPYSGPSPDKEQLNNLKWLLKNGGKVAANIQMSQEFSSAPSSASTSPQKNMAGTSRSPGPGTSANASVRSPSRNNNNSVLESEDGSVHASRSASKHINATSSVHSTPNAQMHQSSANSVMGLTEDSDYIESKNVDNEVRSMMKVDKAMTLTESRLVLRERGEVSSSELMEIYLSSPGVNKSVVKTFACILPRGLRERAMRWDADAQFEMGARLHEFMIEPTTRGLSVGPFAACLCK